jgi:DnaJ-class molecular chaperone
MTEARDFYRILQVDPDAEPEVIAAAFRRLAAKYHPDVNPDPDADERMRELNAAYDVLRDPASRQTYDRARGLSQARAAGVGAGAATGRAATGSGIQGVVQAIMMMVVSGIILNVLFSAFAGAGGRWIAIAVIVGLLLWKGGPIFRYFSGRR